MMGRNVVVLGKWMEASHVETIRQTALKKGFACSFYRDEREAGEAGVLKEAEVIFGYAPETAASSENLRWLCLPSAGVETYLKPGALYSDDIILTNSSGAYGATMAEHMIMVTLMLVRRMTEFQEGIRNREWLRPREQASVKGSRITVLGTGDIGGCFARRIRAFEPAQVLGVNRSGRSNEPAFDRVLSWTDLDQVLPETDILAMSLPATGETRGILSRERIALLPETAYIINVGRGSAIDEEALSQALNEGRLAGAALDVMCHEPLPENDPLWETERLILTPHVAGNMTTAYTKNRLTEMFCEDLDNYGAGRPMCHLVDKKLGY